MPRNSAKIKKRKIREERKREMRVKGKENVAEKDSKR